MKEIKFRGDDLATSRLVDSIRIDFEKGISNIAKGIIPAKTYKEYMKLSEPFFNLDDKSIQYVGVDDESFKKLENINENPYYIAQILIKNEYFLKRQKLPRIIYVYPYSQYYHYMECFFSENIKYLKLLPTPITIEDNYVVDKKTSRKLDNLANRLAAISLNEAIFNIFRFVFGENIFDVLYKDIKRLKKYKDVIRYNPDKNFLNKILILSKTYKKSIIYNEFVYFYNNYNKNMEIFLFLSQKFNYVIPQKHKDKFQNAINAIISNLKEVFSYNFQDGVNFEKMLAESITYSEIMDIAERVCSVPMNKSEYSGTLFSSENLQDAIANDTTAIGYNYNNSKNNYDEVDNNYYCYEDNSKSTRIGDFFRRLSPLIKDKSIIEKLKLDEDFPFYEHKKEGYNEHYYRLHGYYRVSPTDSLYYLNLAELVNQIADSPYPYEFSKQALMSKLEEVQLFLLNTCFYDIPQLF